MDSKLSWQIEQLRFTFLDVRPELDTSAITWQAITGLPPENKHEKPAAQLKQEDGPWEGNQLVLSRQLNRIDILYNAIQQEPSLPNGGEFSSFVHTFAQAVLTLPNIPANRLALGAVVLMPAENRMAAYEKLDSLLQFVAVDKNSTDFLYQVNRPVQSTSNKAVKINRLSRWSVMQVQLISFGIHPATVEPPKALEHHAVRLELDINTAPDTPVPDETPAKIVFEELIELAINITQLGDSK